MRYLFALLSAALLIVAMFALAVGVRATWGNAAPGETSQEWTGGQLLLISLARTIDRWFWPLTAGMAAISIATAALCRPRVRGTKRSRDVTAPTPSASPQHPQKES
jgi:hypothetical protein